MKSSRLVPLAFASLHALLTQAQCEGNLLVNGNFDSPEGANVTATGWTLAVLTPDINDENGPLNTTANYIWTGTPLPSPTGGTWQSLTVHEAFQQVVATIPGSTYSICFDYAQQPITLVAVGKVFNWPWTIQIYLNSMLAYQAPLSSVPYVWLNTCFSFSATTPNTTIKVTGWGDGTVTQGFTYGGIDGICMELDTHTHLAGHAVNHARLSPNPATDHVQVMGARTVSRATLTNAAGQSMPAELNGNRIGLSGVEPGIYTVQCWFTDSSAPHTQRVVVE